MAILITGGHGFIGTNLVQKLINDNHEIVLFLREPYQNCNLPYILYNGGIDFLIKSFLKYNINGIIHLASYFVVNHSIADIDKIINANIMLGTRLAEAAIHSNCKWFINTSTFWQYFNNNSYSPVSLYAASKQALEDILKFYRDCYALKITSLELFDTYGPGDKRIKLFALLKKHSENRETLQMSPGEQKINLLHVNDVVNAYQILINMMESPCKISSNYSVFSNQSLSLKDIVTIYSRISGKIINIEWGGKSYRPREIMDPRPLHGLVPSWVQEVSLEQGIQTII